MTTRFKTSLAAGLAVVTLAAAAPLLLAQDQQPRAGDRDWADRLRAGPAGPACAPGGPMGFGPGFRELDLTDDQKAQLKPIADSHRDEFRAAGDKMRAAREGMRALDRSRPINESAIRAKSTEIAAAEADDDPDAKVRQESLQVLTSEQQAKLKELRTAREGQMKQRRKGGQELTLWS